MNADWYPDISGRRGPRYAAIADEIGEALDSGRLSGGMQLPTQRDLARRLNVTIGTVSRAYQEAERRGLVSGEVGRGTYIRDTARPKSPAGSRPSSQPVRNPETTPGRPEEETRRRDASADIPSAPEAKSPPATDRDQTPSPADDGRALSDEHAPSARADQGTDDPPAGNASTTRDGEGPSGEGERRQSSNGQSSKGQSPNGRPPGWSAELSNSSVVHLFRRSEKPFAASTIAAPRRRLTARPIVHADPPSRPVDRNPVDSKQVEFRPVEKSPRRPAGPSPETSDRANMATDHITVSPINLASSRLPGADETGLRACLADVLEGMDMVELAATAVAPTDTRTCRAASRVLARIGVSAGAGEVIVAPSGGTALDAILAVTTRPGDGVLVEALIDPTIRTIVTRYGLRLNTVQLDREGIVPESFELACWSSQSRLFVVAPSAHNPTATTLSNARRHEILKIAEKYGITIVEWAGSLPAREDSPDALAALAPHRTIHVADLATCAMSGLRLGIVTGPDDVLERIGREIVNLHRLLPGLQTGLLEAVAAPGAYEALIDTQRRILGERRRVFGRAIGAEAMDGITATHSHGWMRLPETWRASDFAVAAAVRGVLVASAEHFQAGRGTVPRAVRLAWGGLCDLAEAANAGAILGQILAQPDDDGLVTG